MRSELISAVEKDEVLGPVWREITLRREDRLESALVMDDFYRAPIGRITLLEIGFRRWIGSQRELLSWVREDLKTHVPQARCMYYEACLDKLEGMGLNTFSRLSPSKAA